LRSLGTGRVRDRAERRRCIGKASAVHTNRKREGLSWLSPESGFARSRGVWGSDANDKPGEGGVENNGIRRANGSVCVRDDPT